MYTRWHRGTEGNLTGRLSAYRSVSLYTVGKSETISSACSFTVPNIDHRPRIIENWARV